MDWCLMAPSRCLNQCWFLIKCIRWHSTEGIFIRNFDELNPWHVFKHQSFRITATSLRVQLVNTLWLRQNGCHSGDKIFKCISWMKMHEFRLRFHWSLFPRVQLTIFQHWLRSWLGAGQAISHYLNQWWLVYWHLYASLSLNELNTSPFGEVTLFTNACEITRYPGLSRVRILANVGKCGFIDARVKFESDICIDFFIPKWIISKDIIVLTVFVWYQSISSLFVCCEPANHSLIWLSSWWLVYNSLSFSLTNLYHYCQTSNVRHTLASNKIVGQSDVVGALLFVAAPTTSSFFT